MNTLTQAQRAYNMIDNNILFDDLIEQFHNNTKVKYEEDCEKNVTITFWDNSHLVFNDFDCTVQAR